MTGFKFTTFVRIFMLAAFLVTIAQATAFAERSIDIINRTGKDIKEISASFNDAGWTVELIGGMFVLKNGQSIKYNFPSYVTSLKLKVFFKDGKVNTQKYDVSSAKKIMLK